MAKPVIRVLLYTDDLSRVRDTGNLALGVDHLIRHLKANESPFAVIEPQLISRNTGPNPADHARVRLTAALLKDFDQVWFFGVHQKNKSPYSLESPGAGGPRSELEPDEILALQNWMSVDPQNGWPGIGTLMAGDHANPPPDIVLPPGSDDFCPPLDHETFLGLGRAIGKGVPRAGELRKWEGPPTHCLEDNFNTQFLPSGGDLNLPQHQSDANPQQLILPRFDAQGNPSPMGQPHELFRGSDGKWIEVFPDHDHEGALVIPKSFPETVWPATQTFQPKPQVIARSIDHRTGQCLNILSAYNGDAVRRGRIVADSSWHHYFNANLESLSADDPSPAARQIGEYYRNLAFWLSPLSKRLQIGHEMLRWLANHPLMLEQAGSGIRNVGRLAVSLVSGLLTGCQLQELLVAACPAGLNQRVRRFVFPKPTEPRQLPSTQVLLGAALTEYFFEVSRSKDGLRDIDSQLPSIVERGVVNAFRSNTVALIKLAVESASLFKALPTASLSPQIQNVLESLWSLSPDNLLSERSTSMIFFFTLTLDRTHESELVFLELIEDDSTCKPVEGISVCKLSGQLDTIQQPGESHAVRGAKIPIDADHAYIAIEFQFRNVRIVASGIKSRTDISTRFFAFRLGAKEPMVSPLPTPDARIEPTVRIDPSDGDTGTGTGTTTFVDSSREGSQDKAKSS